jgi:hypothetical protein
MAISKETEDAVVEIALQRYIRKYPQCVGVSKLHITHQKVTHVMDDLYIVSLEIIGAQTTSFMVDLSIEKWAKKVGKNDQKFKSIW